LFLPPSVSCYSFFFSMIRRLPRPALFPYTTRFRSIKEGAMRLAAAIFFLVSSAGAAQAQTAPVLPRNEVVASLGWFGADYHHERSEEHTSELQSRRDLVCRLLLKKKKKEK